MTTKMNQQTRAKYMMMKKVIRPRLIQSIRRHLEEFSENRQVILDHLQRMTSKMNSDGNSGSSNGSSDNNEDGDDDYDEYVNIDDGDDSSSSSSSSSDEDYDDADDAIDDDDIDIEEDSSSVNENDDVDNNIMSTNVTIENNNDTTNTTNNKIVDDNNDTMGDNPNRDKLLTLVREQSIYDCGVCLSDNVKLIDFAWLGCSHSFCRECISNLDVFKCPTCRCEYSNVCTMKVNPNGTLAIDSTKAEIFHRPSDIRRRNRRRRRRRNSNSDISPRRRRRLNNDSTTIVYGDGTNPNGQVVHVVFGGFIFSDDDDSESDGYVERVWN